MKFNNYMSILLLNINGPYLSSKDYGKIKQFRKQI